MRLVISTISHRNGKWCVLSHAGKSLGCYATKTEAFKRLRAVEYFKENKANADAVTSTNTNMFNQVTDTTPLDITLQDKGTNPSTNRKTMETWLLGNDNELHTMQPLYLNPSLDSARSILAKKTRDAWLRR